MSKCYRDYRETSQLPGLRRCYNNSDPLRHREITPHRLSCGNGRCNRLVAACISRVIFFYTEVGPVENRRQIQWNEV